MVVNARDKARGRNGGSGSGSRPPLQLLFQPGLKEGEEGATGVHRGGVSAEGCNCKALRGSTGMDVIAPNLPATFSPKIHSMPQPAGSDGAQRSQRE